jgi:glycosyltransferase involved in cell wall biosynthesis
MTLMTLKTSTPLVSVIIPIYNGAHFVREALESVLNQNYAPIEIIAVDDGSTDASSTIIQQFGSRIQCCFQKNSGTAVARNKGVTLSNGGFLAFLDQDDVWHHGKLAAQIHAFASDINLAAVFGYTQQFQDIEMSVPKDQAVPHSLKAIPGISPSGMLIRRKSFDQVGPFDSQWVLGEWADWYLRAVDSGLRIKVKKDIVVYRRIHANNKGRMFVSCRNEYVRILKLSLDRRRWTPLRENLVKNLDKRPIAREKIPRNPLVVPNWNMDGI